MNELIPIEIIENKIFIIRGQKVMLDSDLAQLYDVETRIINRNVKRNINRFPEDFMFQLTDEEWKTLKSQIGISNKKKGGRRFTPYVFTEHGILMLSNVLSSDRAITVSIQIIRVFEKLRQFALNQNQLTERIASLEPAFMNYAKENNEAGEKLEIFLTPPQSSKSQPALSPRPCLAFTSFAEDTKKFSKLYILEFFRVLYEETEDLRRAINYLLDITKPAKIGFKG